MYMDCKPYLLAKCNSKLGKQTTWYCPFSSLIANRIDTVRVTVSQRWIVVRVLDVGEPRRSPGLERLPQHLLHRQLCGRVVANTAFEPMYPRQQPRHGP